MDTRSLIEAVRQLHRELQLARPAEEGVRATSQQVVPISIVRGTRGYIESVANQINGAYENGWFDAAAVMMRRLLETLIIECFETYKIEAKIKNKEGDYYFLGELIRAVLAETTWNLTRGSKRALPKLKNIGDKSAHSRRYVAHRADVERVIDDFRFVVQEFTYLAKLK